MAWQKYYVAPQPWQGRVDSKLAERFHQRITPLDLTKFPKALDLGKQAFAIVGFCCDEGVRRNQGRVGAKQGPVAFRQQLSNVAYHGDLDYKIFDVGNIVCSDEDLATAQQAFAEVIAMLSDHHIKPIAIGGGHEIAWAHYQGIELAKQQKNLAIINIDAHFDMRPLVNGEGNSGTPFLQIAQARQQQNLAFDYSCFAIQPHANTQSLFTTADNFSVHYVLAQEIHHNNLAKHFAYVDDVIAQHEKIYLTICLDAFNIAIAPGVSAPQVQGIYPWHIMPLLKRLFQSGKIYNFDIAELAPNYDTDNRTARLAAELVASYLFYSSYS